MPSLPAALTSGLRLERARTSRRQTSASPGRPEAAHRAPSFPRGDCPQAALKTRRRAAQRLPGSAGAGPSRPAAYGPARLGSARLGGPAGSCRRRGGDKWGLGRRHLSRGVGAGCGAGSVLRASGSAAALCGGQRVPSAGAGARAKGSAVGSVRMMLARGENKQERTAETLWNALVCCFKDFGIAFLWGFQKLTPSLGIGSY